jgi:hypothetical protein
MKSKTISNSEVLVEKTRSTKHCLLKLLIFEGDFKVLEITEHDEELRDHCDLT